MDERVLDYGDRAVDDVADAVLDDSVLGLAAGKKAHAKKSGKLLVIVAAGFPPYPQATDEVADMAANRWLPHSEDFRATASANVGNNFFEATNVTTFLGPIANQTRISSLVFIGHGGPDGIGLSGSREGAFDEMLGSEELAANAGTIAGLVAKFDPAATIDLVCCNTGAGEKFVAALAAAFQRCVRAYRNEVFWLHPLNADSTAVDPSKRGYTSTDNANFKKGFKHLAFPEPVCR